MAWQCTDTSYAAKAFEYFALHAFAAQGFDAFVNTKRATAYHEAGHAVVAAAHGFGVVRVWIKEKRFGGTKAWIGRSFPVVDGRKIIMQTTPDSSVADDLDTARNLMAGVVAEMLFDSKDFRQGSSLNEVVFFKACVANIAVKIGASDTQDLSMQLMAQVGEVLKRHADVVEKIANELLQRGTLHGQQLQVLLKTVRPIRLKARTGIGYETVVNEMGEAT